MLFRSRRGGHILSSRPFSGSGAIVNVSCVEKVWPTCAKHEHVLHEKSEGPCEKSLEHGKSVLARSVGEARMSRNEYGR